MNRYLVSLQIDNRLSRVHVDASSITTAVHRALKGFERRDDVHIRCTLIARNIVRDRIEKQSHGRALALDAR